MSQWPSLPSRLARMAARIVCALLCLPLAAAIYLGVLQLTSNFHEVIPGELYRSSQPSPKTIAETQKNYGIKTILNLRGENTGRSWYDAEVAAAKSLNIAHIDFHMSAERELSPGEAKQLIDIMRNAQKPLLIHCKAGADRTGLASALYLAGVAGLGEEKAEKQISIFYGHLPLFFNATYAMDRTFENLERSLGFPNS